MNKPIKLSHEQISMLGLSNFECSKVADLLIDSGKYHSNSTRAPTAQYKQAVYFDFLMECKAKKDNVFGTTWIDEVQWVLEKLENLQPIHSPNTEQLSVYTKVFGNMKGHNTTQKRTNFTIVNDAICMSPSASATIKTLHDSPPLPYSDLRGQKDIDWMVVRDYCVKVVIQGKPGHPVLTWSGKWLKECRGAFECLPIL